MKDTASSRAPSARESATWTLSTGRTQSSLAAEDSLDPSHGRSTQASALPSTGLHVLHTPKQYEVDVVFVHGLGGHSHKTWTKDKDSSLFWPQKWLPLEPGMGAVRILTFGYNAGWRGQPKSMLTMGDFAKDLLYEIRFAKNDSGNELDIGTKPIMLVAHSMGGLVVKQAFLMGMYDENYKDIVASISAIIFLATPHRGSNLAEALSRVVSATMQSPRSFVTDLHRGSTALEELNEQFRHIAPRLSIWSFYETVTTSIGPKKLLILDKDTAVLGYPGEISKALDANHQSVCKYSSTSDINYVSVRNAIRQWVSECCTLRDEIKPTLDLPASVTTGARLKLQDLFRGCATSEDDYIALRQLWIPNTCHWFLKEPKVQSWLADTEASPVLWYNAPPASGKSVLSAFVVNHLRETQRKCQYFFFKYSED